MLGEKSLDQELHLATPKFWGCDLHSESRARHTLNPPQIVALKHIHTLMKFYVRLKHHIQIPPTPIKKLIHYTMANKEQ